MTKDAKSAITLSRIESLSPEECKEVFTSLVWCADNDLLKWMAAYAEGWRSYICSGEAPKTNEVDTKFEQFKMLVETARNPSVLDRMADYLHEYRSSRGLFPAIDHISTDGIRGYVAAFLSTTENPNAVVVMSKVMKCSGGRANPAIVKEEIDRQIAMKNKKGAHTDE